MLGILLMNIVGMGLPAFAYIDPTYAGGSTGADLWTWAVNNVLTDGKMRALFTMLFGASAVLIAERAEGSQTGPAVTHYRRMFWLFVFGMVHAYFLWWGDILVTYSLAGLVIFPFRKLSPSWLLGDRGGDPGVALLGLQPVRQPRPARGKCTTAAMAAANATAGRRSRAWEDASLVVAAPAASLSPAAARRLSAAGLSTPFGRAPSPAMAMIMQLGLMPTDEPARSHWPDVRRHGVVPDGLLHPASWSTRAYALR